MAVWTPSWLRCNQFGDAHTTIHRWTVRFAPLMLERFNRRKRSVTGKWLVDETYIKVRGQ
ncbi:hypothetical protein GCM10007880_62990 [Mesorhizobium amorphae]|nr:hypothetical protein GCM10007880_62990 [Mesorhizobium amorphae]